MLRTLSLVLAAAALAAPVRLEAQDLGARLDSTMRDAEARGFSGVVRIEKDGATVLERGYGLANRADRIPFTPATVVQIGSNTKDFTAVAILQLLQRGRLSLDDSLAKYFRDVPADKRGITIRQLLTHRAGFPQALGSDFEPLGRDALVDRAMRFTLLFAPDTRESYSNPGYSLLAAIIERITGRTYDEYVRDAILAPLGLRRTGFLLPGFQPEDLAHGYLAAGTDAGTMLAKPHAADGPYWNLRGNGGMLSTVDDMHAFYKALFESETLLDAKTRALRFPPDQPIALAGSDGVNFFLYERLPGARVELIIASTNAAVQAPVIRRALGGILGLPDPGGRGERVARREGGMPPPAPVAALLGDFVRTLNAADTTALRRFVAEHFTSDTGGPTLDERMQRMRTLHERLGALTVERIESFPDGSVEMRLRSTIEGAATMRVMVDGTGPYRIRSLQVMIGD